MPRYKVNELSYFENQGLKQPGEEVEYDGVPGYNLDPLDDDAKAAKAAAEGIVNERPKDPDGVAGELIGNMPAPNSGTAPKNNAADEFV